MNPPDWIEENRRTSNPAQVRNTLERLAGTWPSDAPPSPTCSPSFSRRGCVASSHLRLQRLRGAIDPAPGHSAMARAPRRFLARRAGFRAMLVELQRTGEGSTFAGNFRALRFWKGREMLRIALREVAEVAPLEETTYRAIAAGRNACAKSTPTGTANPGAGGGPDTPFTILGLGKLGGRELNHSSDIDVTFAHGEEGKGDAVPYLSRMVQPTRR